VFNNPVKIHPWNLFYFKAQKSYFLCSIYTLTQCPPGRVSPQCNLCIY
jgi:hypothetical protein